MSSTEKKDSPSKEEKKESTATEQGTSAPPKPVPPKPAPTKPEQEEPTAPAFEKSFIDGIKVSLMMMLKLVILKKLELE